VLQVWTIKALESGKVYIDDEPLLPGQTAVMHREVWPTGPMKGQTRALRVRIDGVDKEFRPVGVVHALKGGHEVLPAPIPGTKEA
jgi:hypothetical protein